MFKSKRFVAFVACLVIFTGVYITGLCLGQPIEAIPLGTALFMISGIYIAGQSLRGSSKPEDKL